MRLKSSEDISIATRDRLHALGSENLVPPWVTGRNRGTRAASASLP
jgi:hypothetical protein